MALSIFALASLAIRSLGTSTLEAHEVAGGVDNALPRAAGGLIRQPRWRGVVVVVVAAAAAAVPAAVAKKMVSSHFVSWAQTRGPWIFRPNVAWSRFRTLACWPPDGPTSARVPVPPAAGASEPVTGGLPGVRGGGRKVLHLGLGQGAKSRGFPRTSRSLSDPC